MERRSIDVWLTMQGYHRHNLPPRITWYGYQGREYMGQTDPYTLSNNRRKGHVLHKDYLNPDKWQVLEFNVPIPAAQDKPVIVKAIMAFMDDREYWQGSASEMMPLLQSRHDDIPDNAISLAMEVLRPEILKWLEDVGITVEKKRTASSRVIAITKIR